jgi:hypothetical protein
MAYEDDADSPTTDEDTDFEGSEGERRQRRRKRRTESWLRLHYAMKLTCALSNT